MLLRAPVRVWAAGAMIALAGCGGSTGSGVELVEHRPANEILVLPGDEIELYESSLTGTKPHERFEFGRRDGTLSPLAHEPLLATRQWPAIVPPRERRVRFFYWDQ